MLLELLRGNFIGKGDKEDIKRSPSACGEEPGGLNSPPAGRGDEKADWRPPRVPEPSCSGLGSRAARGEASPSSALFIYWAGDAHVKSLLAPCSPAPSLLVTAAFQPPAEGSALSAARQKGPPPPSSPARLAPLEADFGLGLGLGLGGRSRRCPFPERSLPPRT